MLFGGRQSRCLFLGVLALQGSPGTGLSRGPLRTKPLPPGCCAQPPEIAAAHFGVGHSMDFCFFFFFLGGGGLGTPFSICGRRYKASYVVPTAAVKKQQLLCRVEVVQRGRFVFLKSKKNMLNKLSGTMEKHHLDKGPQGQSSWLQKHPWHVDEWKRAKGSCADKQYVACVEAK